MATRTWSARLWLVTKYGALAVVIVVALLIALGTYILKKREAAALASPFIQSLDHAERVHGDVLGLLVNNMMSLSAEDGDLVVNWLSTRLDRGDQPYLYLIGLYSARANDRSPRMRRGLDYIASGMLVYRVDAFTCADPTATQAIPILEAAMGLAPIRAALQTNPKMRDEVIAAALEYEEKHSKRDRPEWVCAHGLRGGSPPSLEAMQQHRRSTREEFKSKF